MRQRMLSQRTSLCRRVVLAGVLLILAPAMVAAQEDEDRLYVAGQAVAGEVVYDTYCVSCHGPDLKGGSGRRRYSSSHCRDRAGSFALTPLGA
jgi:cytochrome c553